MMTSGSRTKWYNSSNFNPDPWKLISEMWQMDAEYIYCAQLKLSNFWYCDVIGNWSAKLKGYMMKSACVWLDYHNIKMQYI